MARRGVAGYLGAAAAALIVAGAGPTPSAQTGATEGQWHTYGGDLGSTHYSPLTQINATNFSKLEVAWRFRSDSLSAIPDYNMQATPLMVNGVLYFTAGTRRNVVALDAATGELLWMYRIDEGKRAAASVRRLSGRGVAYWTDGKGDERNYFVTIGYQLIALDAKTGDPIKTFGQNGIVDLKQNAVYVFDRQTGQPIWPIVERPVEKGTVPGEWYSPTQPFVTKPPPFDRQGFLLEDVLDLTPELKAEALKLVSEYKIDPVFTPPIVAGHEGKKGLLFVPNGANWPGGALDPDTGILYVFSHTLTRIVGLVSDPQRSNMAFISGAGGEDRPLTVQGLPVVRPPWGRITAIDLNKGEIVWQIAHGETPDHVKNHPALKGITIPRTGRPGGAGGSSGGIGILATKTLIISGEGGTFTTPSGQRGAMLRAYDKATGKEVGEAYMPGSQTGTPMTYMRDDKQYIVVATGGGSIAAELIAYRLP